ncbi:MAG: hypothetical protein BGN88_11905 [Clostridiales bacterium 43-6]|nr:MAG: hypothetical protein BGN88_11905 [Clostridiales bacterium 43-6]
MRLKLIACKVLCRELCELSAPSEHIVDLTLIRQGYHNEPETLRRILQETIDGIDAGDAPDPFLSHQNTRTDFILLGYGLCSGGVTGVSSKKYPLVIPRAHDCITLLLGSKERYRELFAKYSGHAYWYTPGWIENTPMPGKDRQHQLLSRYTEAYGEDNAVFLMETEQAWYRDYRYAAYIKPHNGSYPDYRIFTKECAEFLGWSYAEEQGDISLLQRFLSGHWDETDFLIVPPGKSAVPSYDEKIITLSDA